MYGTVVPVISCTDSDETLVFIISVPIDQTFNCKNKCGKPLLLYRFLIVEKYKKKTTLCLKTSMMPEKFKP